MYPRNEPEPRLIVINLWAGPGAGKSTTAAGLFNLMKNEGYSVELVTEVAKDFVYEDRHATLTGNQFLVLALQEQRLRRLLGKCKIAITDAPIPLSLIYRPSHGLFSKDWFTDTTLTLWRAYENYNVTIRRTKPFSGQGRIQQKVEEAIALDNKVHDLLHKLNPLPYLSVAGDRQAPYEIMKWLQNERGLCP